MVLSNTDRDLLNRCLDGDGDAWTEFVDRFTGLIAYICRHSAKNRRIELQPTELDDLISDVMMVLVKNDFNALRRFKGNSSLSSYLTVVARRVAMHKMSSSRFRNRRIPAPHLDAAKNSTTIVTPSDTGNSPVDRIENRDQIAFAISGLSAVESEAIELFHLKNLSYEQVSQTTGLSINSIGALLSRARRKMRSYLS